MIRASLRPRYFTGVEEFRCNVYFVRFVAKNIRDVNRCLPSVFGVFFTIIGRLPFFFLVLWVNADYRFSEMATRDFLRAQAMIRFSIHVSPFIWGRINGVSRRWKAYVLCKLRAYRRVINKVIPMITGAFYRQASVCRMVQFGGSREKDRCSFLVGDRVRRISLYVSPRGFANFHRLFVCL